MFLPCNHWLYYMAIDSGVAMAGKYRHERNEACKRIDNVANSILVVTIFVMLFLLASVSLR